MNPSEKDSQRFQLAARRVRRRREAIGVTAAELAGRAGVPAGRVEALEAGKPGALRMDELFDLCAALGIVPFLRGAVSLLIPIAVSGAGDPDHGACETRILFSDIG